MTLQVIITGAELNDLPHATANQMYVPRGASYDQQLNPLGSWIGRAEGGRSDLLAAITGFECDMHPYAHQAVRDSLPGAATIFQIAEPAQKGSPA